MINIEKVEAKNLEEFIKDTINDAKMINVKPKDAKFHHNTSYKRTPELIRSGIKSVQEKINNGELSLTPEQIKNRQDENYVNGMDYISLSVAGLDDLYPNEVEYDPFKATETDILIANSIKASRTTTNYGNEFLATGIILPSEFRAIDFRIFKLIEKSKLNNGNKTYDEKLENIVKSFNYLKEIANAMIESKLYVPLREMSDGNITLCKETVRNFPELQLIRK